MPTKAQTNHTSDALQYATQIEWSLFERLTGLYLLILDKYDGDETQARQSFERATAGLKTANAHFRKRLYERLTNLDEKTRRALKRLAITPAE